jgi:hypothetical protein
MTPKEIETYVDLRIQEVKSHSRNWLIVAVIACVLAIGLSIIGFRRIDTMQQDNNGIQSKFDELSRQQKEIAEQDKIRDSTLQADFKRNSAERSQSVSNYKKQSNGKIEHFNSPDFTNDSIHRAFAE